jgi:hypothetical protein
MSTTNFNHTQLNDGMAGRCRSEDEMFKKIQKDKYIGNE